MTRPKNFIETDTETFFETKIFKTETDTLKKLRKVSIPRSLETRCHTLPIMLDIAHKSSRHFTQWVVGSLAHQNIILSCNISTRKQRADILELYVIRIKK